VVGAARVAHGAGFARAIGFDMGGTSTDVSLVLDGEPERAFETVVAGLRVKAPMLRIHTIAAGGGSLCRFDGTRLLVGPESAGAHPGPLAYGRSEARALTLSDANQWLGRLPGDRFPFALHPDRVAAGLADLGRELAGAGVPRSPDELAAGFVEIANAAMAQAIAEVSIARGVDPRELALVAFGGAAGQHACAVARRLGMRTVLLHPLAGLLSAWGIGLAARSWDGQRDAGRIPLASDGRVPAPVRALLEALEREGRTALAEEVDDARALVAERSLDLRHQGAEAALTLPAPADGDFARAFAAAHRARFGYQRSGRAIEVTAARVRLVSRSPEPPGPLASAARSAGGPAPLRFESVWFPGIGRVRAPLYAREEIPDGARIAGPALILDAAGTLALDPGFVADCRADGLLVATDGEGNAAVSREATRALAAEGGPPDPVRIEVLGNRFAGVAEMMGAVLRKTAVSVNIKERLDYSCAVFDAEGGLVANAPHIPVHLGAMGATVRAVRRRFPALRDGDAIATNDPAEGGSHLPDVTVVSPVFSEGALRFYVASRGHQADLGGKAPGSMPADSTTLEDEGVVIRAFPLVREGRFAERELRALLAGARHPARNPDDNVLDLEAMVAANLAGARLLRDFADEAGAAALAGAMRELQSAAAAKVSRELARLGDGERSFADALDEGAPIRVRLRIRGGRAEIDFTGTGGALPGNLNAPRAVVEAAVIYALRSLVGERIPLNGGCLAPVSIVVPPGSLLDPPPEAAVVGGNVETSQRLVDVLLGAMGVAAASQGTMNNLAFGDAQFGYYETIGGGAGATPHAAGASAVHTHMTNTRITDPEVLESRAPVLVREFAVRRGSGGAGRFRGGDGVVRELEFTAPVQASLLSQRRTRAPFGLAGGGEGKPGVNWCLRRDGRRERLPGLASVVLAPGDRLRIETPGGGGWGIDPAGT
jgi:5-oxoprolinase (ATP-hydrolysing)